MAQKKKKNNKEEAMLYKTLQRKLKIEQHEFAKILIHKKNIYNLHLIAEKVFIENCLQLKLQKLLSQNYMMLLLVLKVPPLLFHKVILITISARHFLYIRYENVK